MSLRLTARWVFLLLLCGSQFACVTTTESVFTEKASPDKALDERVALARRYIGEENWEDARRNLDLAREIDANSPGVHGAFGLLYQRTGEYELAEEHFRKAIRLDSKQTRTRNNYAAFLIDRKRFEEAEEQLEYVVRDSLYGERARAFTFLGYTRLQLDDSAGAQEALERALAMEPRDAFALLEMAHLTFAADDYSQARRYYEGYRKTVRQQSARALWLGIRLARQSGNKDAEASYALALANRFPNSPEHEAYEQSQSTE
ncbi:MAG: type IV pilus biogenesis/stability protein PilW [Halioglobus sp.]|nr:type IV pilus biogenesis/stability protein PilW [Halioglobus sp.]